MKQEEVKCICPSFPWNPLKPFSHYDPSCPKTAPVCRGCEQILLAANLRVADGCPCNTKRGINHGLVPVDTCTCSACDPSESGSSRYCQPNHPARIVYPGKFLIQGSSGRPEEADATIARISEDQKTIDKNRRLMAEEIVSNQKLTTLEDAKAFAARWIETAAQHCSNEEYYRKERDKLEAQLSKGPVATDLVQRLIDLLECPSPDARAVIDRIETATHQADLAAERLEAAASKAKRAAEEMSAAGFRR